MIDLLSVVCDGAYGCVVCVDEGSPCVGVLIAEDRLARGGEAMAWCGVVCAHLFEFSKGRFALVEAFLTCDVWVRALFGVLLELNCLAASTANSSFRATFVVYEKLVSFSLEVRAAKTLHDKV